MEKEVEASSKTEDKPKSRKPSEALWRQQKMSACKPVWSGFVLGVLFTIAGIVFVIVGGILLGIVRDVKEYELDYTRCATTNNRSESSINQSTCADYLLNTSSSDRLHLRRDACQCNRTFVLRENFTGPVYVYYFLTEFFQNHRRYVKSRDDDQLMGDPTVTNGNCDPFEDGDVGDGLLPYAPCGMIANSLFNDSFNIASSDGTDVNWTRTGIAWPSDYKGKFKNPEPSSTIEELKRHFVNVTLPPPSWPVPVWGLSSDVSNTGFINEDLIVWMRTAAFPRFRKLYAKIEGGLQAGVSYTVKINYNFPVTVFDGTKSLVFSTTSSIGGRRFFVPIIYLVVGGLLLLFAIAFFLIYYFVEPKRDEKNWTRVREFKQ